MALIRRSGCLNIKFYVRDPANAHPFAEVRVLAYFCVKVGPEALAVERVARIPPKRK